MCFLIVTHWTSSIQFITQPGVVQGSSTLLLRDRGVRAHCIINLQSSLYCNVNAIICDREHESRFELCVLSVIGVPCQPCVLSIQREPCAPPVPPLPQNHPGIYSSSTVTL